LGPILILQEHANVMFGDETASFAVLELIISGAGI